MNTENHIEDKFLPLYWGNNWMLSIPLILKFKAFCPDLLPPTYMSFSKGWSI